MSKAKKLNLVVLNGSPRRNGNTATVLGWLEKALQKRNIQITHYDLYPMQIKGCAHCDACKKNKTAPACVIKDDLPKILDAIIAADGIIIASPIYCWTFSACIAAVLNRFYALFKRGTSLIHGKKMAGVFTAGGDHFDGMELCVAGLKRIAEHAGVEYLGTLSAIECDDTEKLRQDQALQKMAAEFAKKF
jgi:multimeric flavodoxin WrbA